MPDFLPIRYTLSQSIIEASKEDFFQENGSLDWRATAAKIAIAVFPIFVSFLFADLALNVGRMAANSAIALWNYTSECWSPSPLPPLSPEPALPPAPVIHLMPPLPAAEDDSSESEPASPPPPSSPPPPPPAESREPPVQRVAPPLAKRTWWPALRARILDELQWHRG